MPRPGRAEGGYVLILVLWMTVLLAVIGGAVIQQIRSDRLLVATEIDTAKLDLATDGAINRAILSLLDPTDPMQWRIDGTAQHVTIGSQRVAVSVSSEAGRIDINAASASLLSAIFLAQGVPANDSQTLADRIVAWRSPIPGAAIDTTAGIYADARRPYTPRHAAFRSVGEVRLVLGMTDALQESLAALCTVYTGSPNIDLGVSGDAVLQVLSNGGNNFAASQLAARRQGNAAGVDRRPAPGEALRIEARASHGTALVVRTAVIRLQASQSLPYQVLAWH